MKKSTPLSALVLAVTLLTPLASANVLDTFGGSRLLWFNLDPTTDTIMRVSSLGDAWPLDMPPWDFVEAVVNASCTERACYHPVLQVPVHILVHDDSEPVLRNVTLLLEGVFDPNAECCTRDNMVRMMGMMLKEMYDSSRTEFLFYDRMDPELNQSVKEYRPIYTAPRALSVGVGFRAHEQNRHWLSLKIDSPSRRQAPFDECKRFLEIRHRLSGKLKTEAGHEKRGMGYVQCLWPDAIEPPVFDGHYESPATKILKEDEQDMEHSGDE